MNTKTNVITLIASFKDSFEKFICYCGAFFIVLASIQAEELTLSSTHQPEVLLAPTATPAEKYAAEELSNALGKMLQMEVPIRIANHPTEDHIPIFIGRHERNADLNANKFAIEEAVVDIRKDSIHLAGGWSKEPRQNLNDPPRHDRGTLYAAYDFLESLGVRWFRPEEFGEHIPHKEKLSLSLGKHTSKPVYQYRYGINDYQTWGATKEEREMARRWAVRNRQNCNIWTDVKYGGYYEIDFSHSYDRYLPPSEYFSTHPEYFALVNGKRSSDPNAQLCLSNPEVEEKVFQAILKRFADRPNLEIASLDPNDYAIWCECDLCRAMDDPKLKAQHSGNMPDKIKDVSMSNRVVAFNNRIARRLAEVLPEKRVGWYAYAMHTEVPTRIDHLEPNTAVMPVAFAGSFSDYSKGLYNPKSRQNAAFLKILRGYSDLARKNGSPLLAHDYWSFYVWPGPLPALASMVDKLQHYHRDFGVTGVYNETHPCWGPQGMLLYFYTWLLRNPDADVEKEKEDYYSWYYGPASTVMKAYHERLESAAWEGPVYFGSGGSEIESLFTQKLLTETGDLLYKAAILTKNQAPYDRRLEGVITGHKYAQKVRDFFDHLEKGVFLDASKALDELEAIFKQASDGSVFDNRSSESNSWKKLFDRYRSKIHEATAFEALFEAPTLIQQHRDGWRFQTDSEQHGEQLGWANKINDSNWPLIQTVGPWQKQGFPEFQGKAWYRKVIQTPKISDGKRLILYFPAVDGDAIIYWNGKKIGEHLLDPKTYAGWNKPFYFDITDIAEPDQPNQIAVSVEKNRAVGGITSPVGILEVKSIYPPE